MVQASLALLTVVAGGSLPKAAWAARTRLRLNVIRVSGTVRVNGTERKPVRGDTLDLGEGDTLEVLGHGTEKGEIQIETAQGHSFQLTEGRVGFQSLAPTESIWTLTAGRLLGFVLKGVPGAKIKVRTQEAVMGVRGTRFWFESLPGETYVCVCEGSVEVANAKGSTLVDHGFDAHVRPTAAPKSTESKARMRALIAREFEKMGHPLP